MPAFSNPDGSASSPDPIRQFVRLAYALANPLLVFLLCACVPAPVAPLRCLAAGVSLPAVALPAGGTTARAAAR